MAGLAQFLSLRPDVPGAVGPDTSPDFHFHVCCDWAFSMEHSEPSFFDTRSHENLSADQI